jgi:hypothetical protein
MSDDNLISLEDAIKKSRGKPTQVSPEEAKATIAELAQLPALEYDQRREAVHSATKDPL